MVSCRNRVRSYRFETFLEAASMTLAARAGFIFSLYLSATNVCLRPSSAQDDARDKSPLYRSPDPIVLSPDGETFYAGDVTTKSVVVFDTKTGAKRGEISLRGAPRGLAISSDGDRLFVAERGAGDVAIINLSHSVVLDRIATGCWPLAIALAEKTHRLYVCNQDRHTVSVIDLQHGTGKSIAELKVEREPNSIAVTPDERYVVVSNLLPHGVATDPDLAAVVSIINGPRNENVGTRSTARWFNASSRNLYKPRR